MQQQNEGGRDSQYFSSYPRPQPATAAAELQIGEEQHQKLGDLGIAEAASPISSRPPATANFEDMMRVTGEAAGGSGGTTGNRWPRQETMALLRIRSEMDAVFRDASPKGPLWEQVSRKLAELGYTRNAKKCKEKFENVHKYYKRTKEGRTGRQDGKSYKFFNELEALHHTLPNTITPGVNPLQILHPTHNPPPVPVTLPPPPQITPPSFPGTIGISFSSNNSSSSEREDRDDQEDIEMESADTRKRKRSDVDFDSDEKMMKLFEDLMGQVMQKQEAMQQRFLEAIEKREQDRMIREEAWKRQDIARLAQEHEQMAQERAISASRDAAIISFLQKITGQTIHLPTTVPLNPPLPTPVSTPMPSVQQQPQSEIQIYQHQHDKRRDIPSHSHKPQQSAEMTIAHQPNSNSQIVASIPKQQDFTVGGSSRWPKAEILALIQLRSGMETRYQEAGPKGPLWEEISAGMQRIGYSRNPKRCKEKWENINKYYKKVKESKKTRPEDAKTCPYFHELDALYQKKATSGITISGGIASSSVVRSLSEQETPQQQNVASISQQENQPATGEHQPEDIVRKQHQHSHGNLIKKFSDNNNLDQEINDEENYEEVDENEEYDDETEEEMKMAYKIQCQRPNVGTSNGNGQTSSTNFMAMVQ